MNKYVFSALLFMSLCSVTNAQKFGYINSQDILEFMPEFKTANSELDVMKGMFEKKGKDMVATLQAKYQDLQKKQESGTVAPIDIQNQADALKKEEAALGEFEKTSQTAIYTKTEELLKPLQEKFNKAVKDVAAENGFSYIFDSGAGLILYSDPSSDATKFVKAKLGIAP
jgi:outer membrane protein